jgi:hypothetical protein
MPSKDGDRYQAPDLKYVPSGNVTISTLPERVSESLRTEKHRARSGPGTEMPDYLKQGANGWTMPFNGSRESLGVPGERATLAADGTRPRLGRGKRAEPCLAQRRSKRRIDPAFGKRQSILGFLIGEQLQKQSMPRLINHDRGFGK